MNIYEIKYINVLDLLTFITMSEFFQTSLASTTLAPAASYSASEKCEEEPAPFSIKTLKPGLVSLDTD